MDQIEIYRPMVVSERCKPYLFLPLEATVESCLCKALRYWIICIHRYGEESMISTWILQRAIRIYEILGGARYSGLSYCSERSLSSDLCHDRCACMAGQEYLNKMSLFWFQRRPHGNLLGVSSSCVVCAPLCSAFLISFPDRLHTATGAKDTLADLTERSSSLVFSADSSKVRKVSCMDLM
ncbi:uncharacterized protein LOC129322315 [Prosopis cineraria]|uniref:uncharacterized protein LOC129322315 n=1 Tax=Prosopis cineraria TaxID=364024 RepID=UPI0024106A41|nr:uncharacterized protein LOC129322315 [Prosopis cineraria]